MKHIWKHRVCTALLALTLLLTGCSAAVPSASPDMEAAQPSGEVPDTAPAPAVTVPSPEESAAAVHEEPPTRQLEVDYNARAHAAEAAEAEASGRACFWARCSRTIITTTAPARGLAPDPAVSAAAPDPAAAAEAALAEAAEVSEEVEAGSAVAADKKFSSMNRPFAHILSPYLKKGGSFV